MLVISVFITLLVAVSILLLIQWLGTENEPDKRIYADYIDYVKRESIKTYKSAEITDLTDNNANSVILVSFDRHKSNVDVIMRSNKIERLDIGGTDDYMYYITVKGKLLVVAYKRSCVIRIATEIPWHFIDIPQQLMQRAVHRNNIDLNRIKLHGYVPSMHGLNCIVWRNELYGLSGDGLNEKIDELATRFMIEEAHA